MHKQQLNLPNGKTISYLLEHRQRRTVGLKITQEGLVVHAPKRILAYQLNQILQEKSNWIQNKLAQREANQVPPMQWLSGERLMHLGQTIELVLRQSSTNKIPVLEGNHLIVTIKALDASDLLKRKVILWYKKYALQDFARRLAILSVKLGVPTPPLFLSSAQSRWGSCNSKGEVRLNWRLIQAPPHIIQYVICHELAHLKEMNHSAKFYAVLALLYPDYKNAEKEIKQLSPALHRMA